MKNLQKGFIVPIIFVIIVLLAVGGSMYVYKNKMDLVAPVDMKSEKSNQVQQQTNTQNYPDWKTYENTKYRFSIRKQNMLMTTKLEKMVSTCIQSQRQNIFIQTM